MSSKRGGLELAWAGVAGTIGLLGSAGGYLARFALVLFVVMAAVVAGLTVYNLLTRPR